MRTLSLLTLFTLYIHFLHACPVFAPWRTIRVIDRTTHQPLFNAKITMEEDGVMTRQGMTDSTGKFNCWGHDETFRLRISHPEYLAFVTKLKTDGDCNMEVTVLLSKTKRHIMRTKEFPINRVVYSRAAPPNPRLNADVSKDKCFHKASCLMQHYSRKAMQEQTPGTRLFNEVLVYPNPAAGGVVYVESKFDSPKTVLLYNMAGTEVIRSEIVLHQTIDTGQLPPGIYFLKVIDEQHDDVTVKKIVVP